MRKNRILALALAACILAGCTAQVAPETSQQPAEAGEVSFYYASAGEKIMQSDKAVLKRLEPAAVNLFACRGEYESGQIILHADNGIDAYTVEADDLHADGNVFSKENIEVYVEKYIEVKENFEGNGAPLGMYPDALLPVEKTVEYGENKVPAGCNQGIYISFRIPTDQPAGTYTGMIRICYDGKTQEIPVTLEVANYTVSQTVHIKSKFNVAFHSHLGELDSTQSMLNKYINTLAEFRLSPGAVVNGNDQRMQEHIDVAYELTQNEKMASFALPAPGRNNQYGIYTLNNTVLTSYLNAVTDKCMSSYDKQSKSGFNLAAKAVMTCSFIDEFNQNPNKQKSVPYVLKDFHLAVYNAAQHINRNREKWAAEGIDTGFIDMVYDSILKFPMILSVPYDEKVVKMDNEAEHVDYGEAVFCPYISAYDSPAERELYNSRNQRWTYVCNFPKPPYGTYHLEDQLWSARVMGWQLFDYNIGGLFYWATDVYSAFEAGNYHPLDDYYDTALRFTTYSGHGNCNGDGFLFYPGAPYGIDGPVASLRLHAIRDGMEDYELLYALGKRYEQLGYSHRAIVRDLTEMLYVGAKISTDSSRFQEARKVLISLLEASESELALAVTHVKDLGDTAEYTIAAAEGTEIRGENIRKDGKVFIATVDKCGENPELHFTASRGECSRTIAYRLHRTRNVIPADQLAGLISKKDGKLSAAVENNQLKIQLAPTKNGRQSFLLKGNEISSISRNTYKFEITLCNSGKENITVSMYIKTGKNDNPVEIKSFTIPASGEYKLAFTDFASYFYNQLGDVESLTLYLEKDKGNHGEKNLIAKDLVITNYN